MSIGLSTGDGVAWAGSDGSSSTANIDCPKQPAPVYWTTKVAYQGDASGTGYSVGAGYKFGSGMQLEMDHGKTSVDNDENRFLVSSVDTDIWDID